jgi:glycine oxidase
VGSTVAYTLAKAGVEVVVADPAPPGANASGVAAGMLAPAFESLFDEPAARFSLLRDARDLWPELAAGIGLPLDRRGAIAMGGADQAEAWAERLAELGAEARRLSAAETAGLAPGMRRDLAAVLSPEDWRLEPRAALAALRAGAEGLGARFANDRLEGFEAGEARLASGVRMVVDLVVLATGPAQEVAALAPEVMSLSPVKGHILRSSDSWDGATIVVRGMGVYLAPSADGAVLGASMETGRSDATVDRAVVDALLTRAEAIAPDIGKRRWRAQTGVRAETPDGLPLAGFSRRQGVMLAAGARRNGWLLAPMLAEVVRDLVLERAGSEAASLFDPARAIARG